MKGQKVNIVKKKSERALCNKYKAKMKLKMKNEINKVNRMIIKRAIGLANKKMKIIMIKLNLTKP